MDIHHPKKVHNTIVVQLWIFHKNLHQSRYLPVVINKINIFLYNISDHSALYTSAKTRDKFPTNIPKLSPVRRPNACLLQEDFVV